MSRWWRGKNPDKTKKEMKRERAEVKHSCPICEQYHPKVRKTHGKLVQQFRELNTAENALKFGRVREHYWEILVNFERNMAAHDARAKEFDSRMATYRGRDNDQARTDY